MKRPQELIDFDDKWNRPDKEGRVVVDLYQRNSAELVDEYNNLVEVVNMLLDEAGLRILEE